MFNHKPAETSSALMDQAAHAADRVARSSQNLANGVVDSLRDTSHLLRVKAEHASDKTVRYIQHEPVKALLMAAATGAALMALVSLISRSRNRY